MSRFKKTYIVKTAALMAAVFFVLVLSSCSSQSYPAWTYAFYLDGSGSLLLEQQRNLREIIQGCQNMRDANVVIYLDRGPEPHSVMFYGWQGRRMFHAGGTYKEVLSQPLKSELPKTVETSRFSKLSLKGLSAQEKQLVEDYYQLKHSRFELATRAVPPDDEKTMLAALQKNGYVFGAQSSTESTQPENIARFFSMVRDNYPAKHYAFFIAGHGLGWFSGKGALKKANASVSARRDAVFYADAIRKGLLHNEPDILCLDLCFMADVESVYALRSSASYLILGQGPLPSAGQDYGFLFDKIMTGDHRQPEDVAKTVFDSVTHALDESRHNSAAVLIKTGPAIDHFVAGFSALLRDEKIRKELKELPESTLSRLYPWGGIAHEMVNVRELMQTIHNVSAHTVPDMRPFVMKTHSTSPKASGLSLYFPYESEHYALLRDEYAGLGFTKAVNGYWLEVLDGRLGGVQH